ncbi:MAG: T9SS type A sorting domain-containing protein [bacterium]
MKPLFKRLSFVAILAMFAAVLSLSAAKPVLMLPQDAADCVNPVVKLIWGKTTYATNYTVEIAYDQAFSNVFIVSNNITDTFHVANLNYQNTYYWRVTANFASYPPETSDIRSFITKNVPPALEFPVNNERCVFGTTHFSWEAGADSFDIMIAEDQTFQTLVVDSNALHTAGLTYNFTKYGKTYWWKVRSYWGNCETEYSDVRKFYTPQTEPSLMLPDNNVKGIPLFEAGTPFKAEFSWIDVNQYDDYRIQISNSVNFNTVIIDSTLHTSVVFHSSFPESRSIKLTNLNFTHNTKYYWRVLTINNGCEGKWAPYRTFKTPYSTITGVNPGDGDECNSIKEHFVWRQQNAASAYRLEVYKDLALTDTVFTKSAIKDTNQIVDLKDSLTKFYWRVRAEDVDNIGLWSPIKSFTTTQQSPLPISPVSGSTGLELLFPLVWQDLDTNDVYDLQVATDQNFQSIIIDVESHNRAQFLVNLPLYNVVYYWKVRAKHNQCYSAWSPVFTFKTTLSAPVLELPADHAQLQPLTPLMQWKTVPSATYYIHQIAKDLQFQDGFKETPYIVLNNARVGEYVYSEFTTYYWRVKAKNTECESDWSVPFSFKTGTIFPPIPEHFLPKDESTAMPTEVKLEWILNPKVDSVDVQLYDTYDLTKKPIAKATLDTVGFDVTNLGKFHSYYWRLRAKNIMGISAWSNLWEFRTIDSALTRAPKCIYPKDKAVNIKANLQIDWEDLGLSDLYYLQVAKDDQFTDLIIDQEIPDDEMFVYSLEYLTQYFWRVKANNEAGWGPYSAAYTFTTQADPASVNEQKGELKAELFPNPVKGKAILSFFMENMDNISIRIESIDGKNMDRFNYFMSAGEHKIEINTEQYPTGSYMYIIRCGNKSETGKFIVTE